MEIPFKKKGELIMVLETKRLILRAAIALAKKDQNREGFLAEHFPIF